MKYTCETSGCSEGVLSRLTCDLCSGPRYCSELCKAEDWERYHSFICTANSADLLLSDFLETTAFEKKLLGKGAYGQVKLLVHKASGRHVALKQISKSFIKRNSSIQLIINEIRVQQALKHPNIVKLIVYFEDSKYVYMLLEYASKGSLFQLIRKKRGIPEQEAWDYITQTCFGLKYLHSKNIIHRDLKPENILIDDKGTIKICDFGWCVQSDEVRTTFCGTLDYMAPEILENIGHSFPVDCWALGVLLYELLHGVPPFRARDDSEKVEQILSNQIAFKPGLSAEVKDLVRGLIQKDPGERLTLDAVLAHPWVARQAPHCGYAANQPVLHPSYGPGQIVAISGLLCSLSFASTTLNMALPEVVWSVEFTDLPGPVITHQLSPSCNLAVPMPLTRHSHYLSVHSEKSLEGENLSVVTESICISARSTAIVDTSKRTLDDRVKELQTLCHTLEYGETPPPQRFREMSRRHKTTREKTSWFSNLFGCTGR